MLGKDGAPIYSSPALVQNSQTTHALSYRWRDYPEKCCSKPVISRTTLSLADNSCATSIRQHVRCRIDVVATPRNVLVNPSYLGIMPYYVAASRTGPVIFRSMSLWSTGGSEHARAYDSRRNVYENCTTIYG